MFFGAMVGYYKAKADFTEKLHAKMDYTSCSTCDMRGIVREQGQQLGAGDSEFKAIRAELASINTNVALLAQRLETKGFPGGVR